MAVPNTGHLTSIRTFCRTWLTAPTIALYVPAEAEANEGDDT
jgi:hypothetical protein